MKAPRLIALALSALLVASPLAWAKGSGFSSSSSSSSRGSGFSSGGSSSGKSGSSYGSPSSPSSNFSSSNSAPTSRAAPTELGKSIYSARASKEAADTYAASKAAPSSDGASRGTGSTTAGAQSVSVGTPVGNSSPSYAGVPSYSPPVAPTPAPAVTNRYQDTGNDSSALTNLALGYMIGHSTSRHDTVVVQQPAPAQGGQAPQVATQGGGFAQAQAPGASPQGSNSGVSLGLPGPADSAISSATNGHVWRVLGWLIGLGVGIAIAVKLIKAWAERKAKFAQKTNYHL